MRSINVVVKAHPKRKTMIVSEDEQGNLVVSIGAQRAEGKANEMLLALLSDHFKVAKTSVKILKGHLSSKKVIGLPNTLTTRCLESRFAGLRHDNVIHD